jgi:hypothetical protein
VKGINTFQGYVGSLMIVGPRGSVVVTNFNFITLKMCPTIWFVLVMFATSNLDEVD